MSVRTLAWAMAQRIGYPSAEHALVMMAEQSFGDGFESLWAGSTQRLAEVMQWAEIDASWTLWFLEDARLITKTGQELDGRAVYRLNDRERFDAEAYQEALHPKGATGNRGAKVSVRRRLALYERDGYRCRRCGSTKDLTLDHVHPQSKGGPTTDENLQTLCRTCNSSKGARI